MNGLNRLVLLLLVSFCSFRAASAGENAKPNVVLILVDDMGYGDPACFNSNSKIATPHIDQLSATGMRFTDAHAPGPLCHQSRYGLMTGRYPFRTDVNVWRTKPVISEDELTLPEVFLRAGYHTSMVGKWHLGFFEKGYDRPLRGGPMDRGFERFFGIRASTDIPPYFYIRGRRAVQPPTETIAANNTEGWSPIQGAFWRAGGIAPDLDLANVLPKFTDEACEVIRDRANEDRPFFLYLALPAPHTPWLPSEEFLGKSDVSLYGDFAMMVDSMVGRVTATLDESGVSQNTMVIFTSDNGPCWYEEDDETYGHDSSGGLRGMKADAWEGGHRMPLVIRYPGVVVPGSVSEAMVSFCDFLATFDELLSTELLAKDLKAAPDSFSFLSELTGRETDLPKRTKLALKSGRGLMTFRRGSWKLIDGDGSGGFSDRGKKRSGTDSRGQLYNLSNDLGETKNLIDDETDVAASMREELEGIIEAGHSR
ncbi:MAG: arylsulfatase [Planctomycetota bacterium]